MLSPLSMCIDTNEKICLVLQKMIYKRDGGCMRRKLLYEH
jgi:hypothetical protein